MSGTILLALRILMVICLYAILGAAIYIFWQNLQLQTNRMVKKFIPPLTLYHQEEESTIDYHFTSTEITIGRDPACDCILNDSTVSALHARLTYRQGQWWVEDLRSTNGTFLNQEGVFTPLVLTSGDQLRCGQVLLSVSISQESGNGETYLPAKQ
ncbi:MAG: FHA domain-containing protein [Anaerolineales bacterium]